LSLLLPPPPPPTNTVGFGDKLGCSGDGASAEGGEADGGGCCDGGCGASDGDDANDGAAVFTTTENLGDTSNAVRTLLPLPTLPKSMQ
jgi:hypothetical protein